MSVFDKYAKYYDLLYQDKDYVKEAAFVQRLIRKYSPGSRSMLELGCGTGRYAREFVRHGWNVLGVDLSKDMVRLANREITRLPARQRARIRIKTGDVRRFRSNETFDVIVSLFHVVNYQTTNAALRGMFTSAHRALGSGGLFIFDFWNGPAVLNERPAFRIKRVEDKSVRVVRLAEPELDVTHNRVNVNYTLFVTRRKTGHITEIQETHSVRYLFLPEIQRFAETAGFRIIQSCEWLTGKPLHDRCWSGCIVARVEDISE